MSNKIIRDSLESDFEPVAHIAHKKHKVALLSLATLSLALTLALATGFTVKSFAANDKDHMHAAAGNHMHNRAVYPGNTNHRNHM
jgi:hypothetical protein